VKPLQPFRWFGSKTRVAEQILRYVPAGKHFWLELFAGSGIVTIVKEPHPQEHLNDMDGDVCNVFRVLRDEASAADLVRAIAFTPYAEEEFRLACNQPETEEPIERARRFLVRCWQGQGGVSRHKTGFRFSVAQHTDPAKVWHRLPGRLLSIAERLSAVTIWRRPAIELFSRFSGEELAVVFADPPYPPHTISSKPRYRVDMTHEEHVALASAFRDARCTVILTMNPGTVYEEILSSWHRVELPVRGATNQVKTELLLTNAQLPKAGPLFEGVST
jgi:DNA adenine methylase